MHALKICSALLTNRQYVKDDYYLTNFCLSNLPSQKCELLYTVVAQINASLFQVIIIFIVKLWDKFSFSAY